MLWGSVIFASLIAAAGLAAYQALTLEQRVLRIMEPYAQLVAVGTGAAVAFQDPRRAQEILETLRANAQILEATIYLEDGRVLANYVHSAAQKPSPWPDKEQGVYIENQRAELLRSLPNGGHLRMVMGLARLTEQTHQLLIMLAGGGLILLLATVGQLAILRRLIVKPIGALTEAAEHIRATGQDSSNDLANSDKASDRHAALGSYLENPITPLSKDEIGDLTVAFNAMAEQLYTLIDSLEDQVVERTRELTESNKQLQIAEKNAAEALQIAESANQAKSTFLANMSHELRTPLNAILGYAELLKRNVEAASPVSTGLETIHRSGEHLLILINDLLDLAKIEAGRLELSDGPFRLTPFIKQIMSILQDKAERKNLPLTYQNSSPLPEVLVADETRLRQVLLNLLGNAIKFNDEGTITLRVEALDKAQSSEVETAALRFMVEDHGAGIEPDSLERIFKPFEQAGELLKQNEGSGLGLAISRKIVEEMGGELKVESELGRGTKFWFDLNLPIAMAIMPEVVAARRSITGYQGEQRKILVVDDNEDNSRLLVDLLEPLQFEVITAEDGQQAVDLAGAEKPDAIVLDLVVPIKSGFEVAQEVRQQPDLENVLIIAISASVMDSDRQKALEAGCDAFLPKPVDTQDLFDLLSAQLALTWIYAEEEAPPVDAPLVAPSSEELYKLKQLVEEGEIFKIKDLAKELEAQDVAYLPFARKLKQLSENMDIAQIEVLIKRSLDE